MASLCQICHNFGDLCVKCISSITMNTHNKDTNEVQSFGALLQSLALKNGCQPHLKCMCVFCVVKNG